MAMHTYYSIYKFIASYFMILSENEKQRGKVIQDHLYAVNTEIWWKYLENKKIGMMAFAIPLVLQVGMIMSLA